MAQRSGRQVHPTGAVATITNEQRQRIRARREELGWRQEDLAARVGVTPATISNLESGRTAQPKKSVYAKVLRALKLGEEPPDAGTEAAYMAIVEGAVELNPQEMQAVRALIESLKKRP